MEDSIRIVKNPREPPFSSKEIMCEALSLAAKLKSRRLKNIPRTHNNVVLRLFYIWLVLAIPWSTGQHIKSLFTKRICTFLSRLGQDKNAFHYAAWQRDSGPRMLIVSNGLRPNRFGLVREPHSTDMTINNLKWMFLLTTFFANDETRTFGWEWNLMRNKCWKKRQCL